MTVKDGDNVPVVQAVPIPAEDGNDPNNYGSSSANGSHPVPSAPLYEGPYEDSSPPPSYQQQEQQGAVVTTIPATATTTTTHVPPRRRNDNDCCCVVCGSIAATVALLCFCFCVLPVIIVLAIIFSIGREVMDEDNHLETQFDDGY